MWELFVSLFVGMDWLVITLLSVGVILLSIEIFVPGFGVFGTMGIISVLAGIIARVVGKNLSALTVVAYIGYLIIIVGIITLIVFGIMVWSAKKGLISKTPFIQNKTAVSQGHTEGTPDYSKLVGKNGITLTDLNPIGKIKVDGEIFDAQSEKDYIYAGVGVKVVKCEGVKIVVEKINNNDN